MKPKINTQRFFYKLYNYLYNLSNIRCYQSKFLWLSILIVKYLFIYGKYTNNYLNFNKKYGPGVSGTLNTIGGLKYD